MSSLFAALEFTTKGPSDGESTDQLDDMSQDVEMLPALDRKDMVAAEASPSASHTSGRVRPVDHVAAELEKNVQLTDMRTTGQGDGSSPAGSGSSDGTQRADNQTTALSPVAVDDDDNPLNFRVLEQYPEFPGGMVELMKWLNANLRYPESARQRNIQGRVVVSFIINKDGTIADAHVSTSVHPYLDREALRVVRMMPRWKPGMEKNRPCRTMFVIPINFKI